MNNTPLSSVYVLAFNKEFHADFYLFVLYCIPVSQRVQATEPSFGNASAASIKHQLNGSQPPQTPTRPSFMGPPLTPASKLPRKTPRPSKTLAEAGPHRELGEGARSAQGESNVDLQWGCRKG